MMKPFIKDGWRVFLSLLLIVSFMLSTSGCAAIIRGTCQTCRVVTNPPGKTIMYNGVMISDGESITIQKHFEPTLINACETNSHVFVELQYDPDPLLICDAALLLLGIVPGLVALGVDFGTGAWRDMHNPQVIYVSKTVADVHSQNPGTVLYVSNEPANGPAAWAPAYGYSVKYHYRYYPSVSVYYDVRRKEYFCNLNGHWMAYASLPTGIDIDLDTYVVLEMGTPKPYTFHRSVVKRYPPGQVKKLTKGNGKGRKVGK